MNSAILCLATCLLTMAVSAKSVTQIGRYTTVDNKPSAAQINPMLTIQQMQFPPSVHSVGDAVNYWLKHSGYKLVNSERQSSELKGVLKQNLPQVDRRLGPMSIQDGLRVLVGMNVFTLVQDPLHRKVSFSLNAHYKKALTSHKRSLV